MDTRINVDLDTKWSWIVAIGSCWVNFCIYGLWRSYGIIYVGFKEKYNINHQTAATPFAITCAIYHLIGPVAGILSYKYSLRSLQLVAVFLASFGVSMVKLSTDFKYVIIGVGIIQGLGLGIIRTLSNVVIQNFFYKYRGIATAISMSGGVFSSFFFPSLGSFLLATTDIETTFLIFGFIILLASIGVLVQRQPRYECNSININDAIVVTIEKLNKSETQLSVNQQMDKVKCTKCALLKNDQKCEICSDQQSLDTTVLNNPYDTPENSIDQSSKQSNKIENSNENNFNQMDKKKKNYKRQQEGSAISNLLFVIKKPMFYVISITFVCYNIYLQVFLMTIVDMTKKFESTRDEVGIKLISLFSLADLIGRLGPSWFLDKNYISLKNVIIICESTLLVAFIGLPNLDNLFSIQIATFVIGLMIGIITILWPLLNVDYFGTDKLAILLGLNCFFSGLESLVRPLLIGYYLDHLKSYKFLYYNISAFSAFVVLIWLIEPLLNKKKK